MSLLGILAATAAATAPPSPALTNSIGMGFVLVQPGSMQVGVFQPRCPDPNAKTIYPPQRMTPEAQWNDADRQRCEQMVKRDSSAGFPVTLPKAFYVGRYEVTQGEWRKVMGTNPSTFQGAKAEGDSDRRPVDSVGWADAQAFVARLNALEHTRSYRLATEFEWEYACRAGGPAHPGRRMQS